MTTPAIVRLKKELKTTVIEANKAGDKAAENVAFAMFKKHFPNAAAKLEAELKAQEERVFHKLCQSKNHAVSLSWKC